MSCKLEDRRPDWKAYALRRTGCRRAARSGSARGCLRDCQEELAALRLTLDALLDAARRRNPAAHRLRLRQSVRAALVAAGCSCGHRSPPAAVVAAAILVHAFVRPRARLRHRCDRRLDRGIVSDSVKSTGASPREMASCGQAGGHESRRRHRKARRSAHRSAIGCRRADVIPRPPKSSTNK